MTNRAKFDYNAPADTGCVAEYLTRIAEGLRSGSISLTADKKTINLAPSQVVRFEIDATSSAVKGRGSLVLEISWKAVTESARGTLEISTQPVKEDDDPELEPNPAGALGE